MLEFVELSTAGNGVHLGPGRKGVEKQAENGQRLLISEVFREAGCSASSRMISKIYSYVGSWKESTPSLYKVFGGRMVGGHC